MASTRMRVDLKGLDAFTKKLKQASSGDLKEQYNIWLEGMGLKFLDIVQDEIIRLGVTDTRRLLNSFSRGDGDCVFSISNTGLSLKVGTNVQYAQWVNDGHYVGSKKLTRKTKTGRKLALKNIKNWGGRKKWIEGYHYFDISLLMFERIFTASLEKNLQKWLDTI
jgi:hypothetical protein